MSFVVGDRVVYIGAEPVKKSLIDMHGTTTGTVAELLDFNYMRVDYGTNSYSLPRRNFVPATWKHILGTEIIPK